MLSTADLVVRSRWVMTQKTPELVRARLVAQEINWDGASTERDTFAACPTTVGQHITMFFAGLRGWKLQLGDVKTAFLHAPHTSRTQDICPASGQRGRAWSSVAPAESPIRLERGTPTLSGVPGFVPEHAGMPQVCCGPATVLPSSHQGPT